MLHTLERLQRAVLHRRGFQSRFHQTAHGDVHYYERHGQGSQAPLVILHGIGSSATAFSAVLMASDDRRRIVAPDALGHGFSQQVPAALTPEVVFAALASTLDALLDRPAVVFGNSMGGSLALRYALERPERVERLILSAPAAAPMDRAALDEFLLNFRFVDKHGAEMFLRKLYHRPPWYLPLISKDMLEVFRGAGIRHLLDTVAPEDFARAERLGELAMPVMLVWGRSERLIPAAHLAFLRQRLPKHAKIVEPDEVGHVPHLERPRMLAKLIADFAAAP